MAINNRFRLFFANGYAQSGMMVFNANINNWKSVVYTPPTNILTIFRLGKNRFILSAVPDGKCFVFLNKVVCQPVWNGYIFPVKETTTKYFFST